MILNRLHNITILKNEKTKNEYGEYETIWSEDYDAKVSIQYLEDQASIELYGQDIKKTKRLTMYAKDILKEFDRIKIDDDIYEVISVKLFKNHNIADVRKI